MDIDGVPTGRNLNPAESMLLMCGLAKARAFPLK